MKQNKEPVVYGQKYKASFKNKFKEEQTLEGTMKLHEGEPVLVNEDGGWIPYSAITESTRIGSNVEYRIREKVRNFLEELDPMKIENQVRSLPDDQKDALLGSILSGAAEAAGTEGDLNPEIVGDEVEEGLVDLLDLEPDDGVTNDVENTIEATVALEDDSEDSDSEIEE